MQIGELDIYDMTYQYNMSIVHQVSAECVNGMILCM
jgi:hypothetical protein